MTLLSKNPTNTYHIKMPIGIVGKVIRYKKVRLRKKQVLDLRKWCGDKAIDVLVNDCIVEVPIVMWETKYYESGGEVIQSDVDESFISVRDMIKRNKHG